VSDFLQHTFDLHQPELAATFDELSFWSARFGAFLFAHLPTLRPHLRILDLGCGTGFPTFELAQVSGPSCQVTGIDTWPEALARAAFKQQVYQLPNVRLLEADAAALPFPEAEFDVIVSNLGINNFADLGAVLAECHRVAKPQASLALTTNPAGHMREFYAVFREVLMELQKPAYLERLRRNEEHRGTKESLTSALQVAGFRVVKSAEDAFHLRYLDGSTLFRHRLTQLGFLAGWRQVVDPADEEEIFELLEAKLNERAAAPGELHMTIPLLYLEAEKPA
jgi:ubiquinone/menaquinone biosynthesis C-methylase UbiE